MKTIAIVIIITVLNLLALWVLLSYREAQRSWAVVHCADGFVPMYSTAAGRAICVHGEYAPMVVE